MTVTPDDIVDTALELADAGSWEALRLHQVAERLGIGLDDIHAHFPEKEALAEAWFDRADRAMLARAGQPELGLLLRRERVEELVMTWLDALAPHRRVTRQMILGKMEPGHLHVQIPGLLRVSRTVQWLREAAGLDAPLPRRALEESALTAIYLATFAVWMTDSTPASRRTREFLRARLEQAGRLAPWRMVPVPRGAQPGDAGEGSG